MNGSKVHKISQFYMSCLAIVEILGKCKNKCEQSFGEITCAGIVLHCRDVARNVSTWMKIQCRNNFKNR